MLPGGSGPEPGIRQLSQYVHALETRKHLRCVDAVSRQVFQRGLG